MLKKGLKALLKADTGIQALVGNRVRVGRIPQGSDYPTVVIKFVASEFINALEGTNATQMRRVQIDCWGNTPEEVDNLAQAVHNLLDSYKGTLSEGTFVASCLPAGDVDLLDEELQLAGLAVDFNVWYTPGEFLSPPV
ncbi:MAG: DUF3168 domain-containing protein [Acidobacteriia bacterium]|nr:DUF3168 domain-containing protein [Terriglobia bacterium]